MFSLIRGVILVMIALAFIAWAASTYGAELTLGVAIVGGVAGYLFARVFRWSLF